MENLSKNVLDNKKDNEGEILLKNETGIDSSVINKILSNSKLRKAFFILLISLGVGGAMNSEAQTTNIKGNTIELKKNTKTFENNDILQEGLRKWIHFIKTNKIIEKQDYVLLDIEELVNKYPDSGIEYDNAEKEMREKNNLINKKNDDEFIKKTSDVSVEEMKKVYGFLESKMDVWNISSLAAFDVDLMAISNLIEKNDPRLKDGYYSKEELNNFTISGKTLIYEIPSFEESYENKQKPGIEEEALKLYHSIRQIIK